MGGRRGLEGSLVNHVIDFCYDFIFYFRVRAVVLTYVIMTTW